MLIPDTEVQLKTTIHQDQLSRLDDISTTPFSFFFTPPSSAAWISQVTYQQMWNGSIIWIIPGLSFSSDCYTDYFSFQFTTQADREINSFANLALCLNFSAISPNVVPHSFHETTAKVVFKILSWHTCCRQSWDSAEVHPYLLLRPKKHY